MQNNPELRPQEVVVDYQLQRIVAGLMPTLFLIAVIVLLVALDKANVDKAAAFILLPIWIAVMVLLFNSSKAMRGGKVWIAVVMAPAMFVAEFFLGLFTITFGAIASGIAGIVLAIIKGGKPPGQGKAPTMYLYPDGSVAPGPPMMVAPPISQPSTYDGHLQWSNPDVEAPSLDAPAPPPHAWPTEPTDPTSGPASP